MYIPSHKYVALVNCIILSIKYISENKLSSITTRDRGNDGNFLHATYFGIPKVSTFNPVESFHHLKSWGAIGVDLFFVISGSL